MLALTGCYSTFEPDVKTKPVLCINSLITAGQPVKVKVTHTWQYDEPADAYHNVDDAVVEIFANGKLAGDDYIAAEGDHIVIKASSPTYGAAEGEVTVPECPVFTLPAPELQLLTGKYIPTANNEDYITLTFNMLVRPMLTDDNDADNYYLVSFNSQAPTVDPPDYDGDEIIYFPYYDALYFSPGTIDYKSEPLFGEHIDVFESTVAGGEEFSFFSDRQINGKKYSLTLRRLDCQFSAMVRLIEPAWYDFYEWVHIASISESYYKWLLYTWHSEWGTLGQFADFGMGDPIGGYSNVSTGAGVIAAQSFTTHKVSLRDFLEQNAQRLIDEHNKTRL